MIGTLFYNPMTIHFGTLLWMLIPLCAGVAVIYKTVRVTTIRRLHVEIVALIAYMLAGLVGLGLALWLVHEYWPF